MANTKITTNVIADGAITSAKLDTNITISGNITGTLATAAQPNITSVGTLTGFTSTGIDDNATSTAITIDSSENVGIGTASPNSYANLTTLTIDGTNGSVLDFESGGTLTGEIFSSSASLAISFKDDSDCIFYGNITERMRITNAGNVGIGTTSPSSKLHIQDSDYTTMSIQAGTTNHGAILNLGDSGDINYGSITQFASSAGEGGRMRFIAGTTETMNLRGGNVGIGTSSPANQLHIAGGTSDGRLQITNNATGNSYTDGLWIGTEATQAYIINRENTPLTFFTNAAERMRIDSSGNCGIGTTSPAATLHTQSTVPDTNIRVGYDANKTTRIGTTSGGDAQIYAYETGVGYHNILLAVDSGSAAGNVGIGTSSPSTRLDITADNTLINSKGTVFIGSESTWGVDKGGQLSLGGRYTDSVTEITYGNISGRKENGTGGSGNGYLAFGTSANNGVLTERMRISSEGNLLINTTSKTSFPTNKTASAFGIGGEVNLKLSSYGTAHTYQQFILGGSVVGSISGTASGTSYNTTSDYRLKENVDYDFTALDRVALLKPARFNFIADADTTVDGFLAHEVQDIVPEAITGEKDAVREEEYEVTPAVLDDDGNVVTEAVMGTREVPEYQGIDQSKLVPLLTKAIQEQQTIIDDLKSRIEALEG